MIHAAETSQRWRAVGDTVFDLTSLGIEAQTSRRPTDSDVLITYLFSAVNCIVVKQLVATTRIMLSRCEMYVVEGLPFKIGNYRLHSTSNEFISMRLRFSASSLFLACYHVTLSQKHPSLSCMIDEI